MIFFDIDDTLLDYKSSQDTAAKAFSEKYATHIPAPDQFVNVWNRVTDHHMARYLSGKISFQEQRRCRIRDSLGLELSDQKADDIFADYYQTYEDSWQLFPDVVDVLDKLAGRQLGVITNGDKANQTYKLNRLGLLSYFGEVITPACAGAAKPDPAIFRLAASVVGKRPEECWYIGDNHALDYNGALASGFNSVWLNRKANPERCDNQCKDLYGFLEMLP